MNIDAVVTYLQTKGVGTVGTDLFSYRLPETVATGIVLLPKLSGDLIDWNLPGFIRTGFQAVVRHTDHAAGEALIQQVADVLTLGDMTIGDMQIRHMLPLHLPIVYPVSKGDFIELSVNFEVVFIQL